MKNEKLLIEGYLGTNCLWNMMMFGPLRRDEDLEC